MAEYDSSELTAAETVALVEADHLRVDVGCDLLDSDDNLLDYDLTSELIPQGSSVSFGAYNTIHRTCTINTASPGLAFGSQRLRPYMLLSSDGIDSFRWNLGVFLMTSPERRIGWSPEAVSIAGYDKLVVLQNPYGAGYSLAAGANVIDAVEALITAAGESKVNIDQTAAADTAPVDKVWPLADDWTRLGIINDLLESVGYRGLWVDRDGYYRSEPYVSPTDLPLRWSYSTSSATTSVMAERSFISEYWQAANKIVGINTDLGADTLPIEGTGIKTLTNQSDGPTSIDARGGQTITRVIREGFVDQSALEAAVQKAMDSEKRVAQRVSVLVSPNPVHSHFDVVSYADSEVPVSGRFLVTDWTLNLDGSSMTLGLKAV